MSINYAQLPWLVYALGNGIGHLNRAMALARIASKERLIIIVSNSPFAPYVDKYNMDENIAIHFIPNDISQSEGIALIVDLLSITPCVLIVDAIPRGIWGELVDILQKFTNTPRILLLRDLPSEYMARKNVETFITQNYELIIGLGEAEIPQLEQKIPQLICTDFWLSRTAQELPTREEARKILKLENTNPNNKTILIVSSGKPEEQNIYGFLAQDLHDQFPWVNIRLISFTYLHPCPLELWISHFPAFECFPAADMIIGGCGYNTFYECMALDIPLIAFPWSRVYDRQKLRAEKAATLGLGQVKIVTSTKQAFFAVSDLLSNYVLNSSIPDRENISLNNLDEYTFKNGIIDGVSLIEDAIFKKWNNVAYTMMKEDIKKII